MIAPGRSAVLSRVVVGQDSYFANGFDRRIRLICPWPIRDVLTRSSIDPEHLALRTAAGEAEVGIGISGRVVDLTNTAAPVRLITFNVRRLPSGMLSILFESTNCVTSELRVSSRGASPVTMTVSLTCPSSMRTFNSMAWPVVRVTPSRTVRRKPGFSMVSV